MMEESHMEVSINTSGWPREEVLRKGIELHVAHGLSIRKAEERLGLQRGSLKRAVEAFQESGVPLSMFTPHVRGRPNYLTNDSMNLVTAFARAISLADFPVNVKTMRNYITILKRTEEKCTTPDPPDPKTVNTILKKLEYEEVSHNDPTNSLGSHLQFHRFGQILRKAEREFNLSPHSLFNVSDFHISMVDQELRISSSSSPKSIGENSVKVLTVRIATTAGGEMLPPSFIFSDPHGNFTDPNVLSQHFLDRWFFQSSDCAITKTTLIDWITRFGVFFSTRQFGRPAVIVLDARENPIDLDVLHSSFHQNVVIARLPTQFVEIVHPNDAEFGKVFKNAIKTKLRLHNMFKESHNPLLFDLIDLCFQTLTEIPKEELIMMSFKSTGIWPIDPEQSVQKSLSVIERRQGRKNLQKFHNSFVAGQMQEYFETETRRETKHSRSRKVDAERVFAMEIPLPIKKKILIDQDIASLKRRTAKEIRDILQLRLDIPENEFKKPTKFSDVWKTRSELLQMASERLNAINELTDTSSSSSPFFSLFPPEVPPHPPHPPHPTHLPHPHHQHHHPPSPPSPPIDPIPPILDHALLPPS